MFKAQNEADEKHFSWRKHPPFRPSEVQLFEPSREALQASMAAAAVEGVDLTVNLGAVGLTQDGIFLSIPFRWGTAREQSRYRDR